MRNVILSLLVLLCASLVGCGSDGGKPAAGGGGGVKSAKNPEAATRTETMENGQLVIRAGYGSATKFTPQFAAQLVGEYDKLKQADPNQEPAQFWEKYGGKTILEVEGTVEKIQETMHKDHRNRPFVIVTMHILPTGPGWGEGKAAQLSKVNAQIATASQAARAVKPGQKVIVRGEFRSFETEFGGENGKVVPVRRNPVLQVCQLVFPKDR